MTKVKGEAKVFLTGANGMLGASICRELIRQGYSVKALILPDQNFYVINGLDIEIIRGNILDRDFLEKEMADCMYVIHTAALTTVWPSRSEKIMTTNIEGTRNVIESAEKVNIRRVVHIGTANSFRHGSKENPGDELTSTNGEDFGLDYIRSKYLAQRMILEKYSKGSVPVVIINPTYMIGPFDSGPSSGKMILELVKGRMPGYSDGGKNFVCSTDVAVASVNALRLGKPGECYIAGNENLTYKEFFTKVCDARNIKFRLLKLPGYLVIVFGFMNSVLSRIIFRPPKLSFTMARIANMSQFYSPKKAETELQMTLTPIEKGITDCINWFESNGYII